MRQSIIQVRPLRPEDTVLLERRLASQPTEKHRVRLAMQQQGQALYLVAWQGEEPVGHVLLKWDGTVDEPMASQLADCPDIEDLWVRPDLRSRGIGSLLLGTAEDLARQRGFSQVGLGVGIDNLRALALYQRRGYQDSGLGDFLHAVYYRDDQGRQRVRWETCTYLIKRLR